MYDKLCSHCKTSQPFCNVCHDTFSNTESCNCRQSGHMSFSWPNPQYFTRIIFLLIRRNLCRNAQVSLGLDQQVEDLDATGKSWDNGGETGAPKYGDDTSDEVKLVYDLQNIFHNDCLNKKGG